MLFGEVDWGDLGHGLTWDSSSCAKEKSCSELKLGTYRLLSCLILVPTLEVWTPFAIGTR